MLSLRTIALAAMLHALTASPSAHACDCAAPGFQLWPTMLETAPRNTHVWVLLPPGGEPPWNPAALELRTESRKVAAPKNKKSKTPPATPVDPRITVTRNVVRAGDSVWVELIPASPLTAMTRVEVAYVTTKGHVPLGILRVGDTSREGPPVESPPVVARWIAAGQAETGCTTARAHLRLELASEDPEPVLYGIWLPDAPADGPPSALAASWDKVLMLGPWSLCLPSNMTVGEHPPAEFVLRVIDRAGVWGAPRTVRLAPVGARRGGTKQSDAIKSGPGKPPAKPEAGAPTKPQANPGSP